MSYNVPDLWVIVEISDLESNNKTQRVLASWYGGYGGSDSWRMSSGIIEVKETKTHYEFLNESGSIYKCAKRSYGMSSYTSSIYNSFKKEETDTLKFNLVDGYEPKEQGKK